MSFMAGAYPWIKALHIISVIAWMSGLLYLPRLFVYHADAPVGSTQAETFKVMEAKLSRIILLPAMIATLLFGIMLAGIPGLIDFHQQWFPVKFVLVLLLLAYHHVLGRFRRKFAEDRNARSSRFYRLINEIPAIVTAAIVILVVVKPF